MWIMISETLYDEEFDVYYKILNYGNVENRDDPDEIFYFETEEEADNMNFDEHISSFNSKEFLRKKKAKEEREKTELINSPHPRSHDV